MLHVTNGRSVSIAETGLGGEVIYWDDVLHEGPVPQLPLEELSELRAHFIAEAFGRSYEEVSAEFERRDEALRAFNDHNELVLWFEHDLYDQLQLLQILAWLAGTQRFRPVSLIQADTYLGPMTTDQLRTLFPSRKRVTEEQFGLASAAWRAFTATEPTALMQLYDSETSALPYLSPSLRRLFEQYPSVRNGLSRTGQQILQVVANGASTMGAAFRADQQLEDPKFMGDSTYARHLRALGACRNPLLHVDEHGTLMKITLRLTATGRNVLAERADHVALNGIDRWLGGIHLSHNDRVWRWSGSALSL